MRRTIGALASSLALGAVLSGCSGDPEPRFAAGPSAVPSTSSPSASAEPEPWEEKTPEGAVAFAKYWTATFSEAFQTGDTTQFEALNQDDCESCEFLVTTVRDIYDQGGSAAGKDWTLSQPAWAPPGEDRDRIMVTGIMQIPELVIRRPGSKQDREAPTQARFNFHLRWQDGWVVERLVRQA